MKINFEYNAETVSHNTFSSDILNNYRSEDVQCDTDFDVYQDDINQEEIILKWVFTIVGDENRVYSIEHFTRYTILEVNDPNLPSEEELEQMLKFSHSRLKEIIKEKAKQLPRSVKVEEFNTFDVFELKEELKQVLYAISEKHNPTKWVN